MEETRADGVKIYCLCREPLGDGTMFGCDACDGWYHERCISKFVDTSGHIDTFICPSCTVEVVQPGSNEERKVTTYKRSCGWKGCRNACDVKQKRKFCSQACSVKWARRALERQGREQRRMLAGLLESCPEGMAQFAGARPGQVPGIDAPLVGQTSVEESPYWRRLEAKWDEDEVAEQLREEIKESYFEDNGGYQHLHDKTVAVQQDSINVVEEQRAQTKYKEVFLEAAKRASKEFCKQYKNENGLDKLLPIKGKPTMHNPPNDVCGYDYRLHANDAWHAAFKSSEEGQAVLAGMAELPLDESGDIHTVGGVETVDPASIEGTICVKIKCRPHFDWANTAAATHKSATEIYDDAIADAKGLIAKLDDIMQFKAAVSKLRANWVKLQLKKLRREQLMYLESIGGAQVNGDMVAVFRAHYKEVLKKMPGQIKEPVMEKVEKKVEFGDGEEEEGDEEVKEESAEEEDEGRGQRDQRSLGLEAARKERRNAKRRETRMAQREEALRERAAQSPVGESGDGDVEMADL